MKKIVIVGAGVTGVNTATKLVDNGYPGELISTNKNKIQNYIEISGSTEERIQKIKQAIGL